MISDTTPEAQSAYETAIARMTPAERVAMCLEMIAVTDGLLRAGIRLRFPKASEQEALDASGVTYASSPPVPGNWIANISSAGLSGWG